MRFQASVIGKIISYILVLILGAVLGLGSLVLVGYVFVSRDGGMGKVQEYGSKIAPVQLNWSDEILNMSVLSWATNTISTVSNSESTIGDIENMIGMDILSTKIEDLLGVDAETIKTSTISNLGSTVTDNLTVNAMSDKFGITFPDMPLFKDAEFLESPVSTAFSTLTDHELQELININGDSNKVLQALKAIKVSELGGSEASKTINSLFIGEIVTIDDSSSQALKALKYSTIESSKATIPVSSAVVYSGAKTKSDYIYYNVNDIIYVAEKDDNGAPIIRTVDEVPCYAVFETKEFEDYLYPIMGINDKIGDLTLGELITIDSSSSKILQSLKGSTLNSLSGDIDKLFMSETMTIDSSSTLILQSLKNSTIESQKTTIPSTSSIYTGPTPTRSGYTYYTTDDGVFAYIGINAGDTNLYDVYKTKLYDTDEDGEGDTYYPLVGINDTIDTLKLNQVIEDNGDNKLLTAIGDANINKIGDAINHLLLCEIIEINGSSPQVLQSIQYSSLESQKKTIIIADSIISTDAGSAYNTASVYEGYDYYEYDGKLYAYIGVNAGDSSKYDVYETKLHDGTYYPLVGIGEKLDKLTIGDVFTESQLNEGVLSLIPADTRINNLSTTISTTIKGTSLAILKGLNIVSIEDANIKKMQVNQQAFMLNGSMTDVLNGMIQFIGNPVDTMTHLPNYHYIQPVEVALSSNYASLSAFANDYDQGNTIKLEGNVTVTIDSTLDADYYDDATGCYIVPIFNFIANTYTLTFSEDVKLGIYDSATGNLAKNQYGYSFGTRTQGWAGTGSAYYSGAYGYDGTILTEDYFSTL